ncbi:hypothetical protein GWK47_041303 [Chionoecetes opilio]|uniref:Uncharacterized protein n=1 Tax=Chionoecetes opilio TaxID=41210 RepID=A0A8J4YI20_CHIOP|nr:hypothetical protein GWK47_041303 [Chionoecetes opilio]
MTTKRSSCLLSVAYLGGGVPTSFRAPGAYHMARWMAKAIYAVKIMLFHDQLEMSRRELGGIRLSFVFFVTMVYAKYWNEAMIPSYAARTTWDFITDVKRICDDGVCVGRGTCHAAPSLVPFREPDRTGHLR